MVLSLMAVTSVQSLVALFPGLRCLQNCVPFNILLLLEEHDAVGRGNEAKEFGIVARWWHYIPSLKLRTTPTPSHN